MESQEKLHPSPKKPINGWELALERAPLFLSVILLFALPFLIEPEGADPLYPKQALAQMMVWLILIAWAVKTFLGGRLIWVQTPALKPLLALVGWSLFTLALSSYKAVGWGQFAHWAAYPLWYWLLTLTCLESWKAENLLLVFLFSAMGTCGWAMHQALSFENGPGVAFDKKLQMTVTAGFGSPDFLAGYLLMVWPVALALYLRANHLFTRLLWSGLLVLSLFCLFWTDSKPGWAGAVVGALVYGFAYFGRGKKTKSIAAILAVATVTVGMCLFLPSLAQQLRALELTPTWPFGFKTSLWKGSIEMAKAHPFKGTGFGTFETAFPTYRPVAMVLNQTAAGYAVKHASNWLFEWSAETGLLGLFLLLVVGWFTLTQWWRLFSANAIPRPLGSGVFAAFAGVLVDNLFDWNLYLSTTLIPFLFLAAMPVALSQRFYRLEGFPIRCHEIEISKFRLYLLPVLLAVFILAFNQVEESFRGQLTNMQMKKAQAALEKGNWEEVIRFCTKVLELEPANLSARYSRGLAYFNRGRMGDVEKALEDLRAVEMLSPDYQQLHFKEFQALLQLNRADEAKVELKRAVRLDPMLIYLTDDFKKARELTADQKYSMAFIVYQNLILDYPTCVPMLVDYANCLALAHDYESAINLYRRVLDLDPGNAKALNNLQKVSEAEKKPLRLNPAGLGMGLR